MIYRWFQRYPVWQYCEAAITIGLAGFIVGVLTSGAPFNA